MQNGEKNARLDEQSPFHIQKSPRTSIIIEVMNISICLSLMFKMQSLRVSKNIKYE